MEGIKREGERWEKERKKRQELKVAGRKWKGEKREIVSEILKKRLSKILKRSIDQWWYIDRRCPITSIKKGIEDKEIEGDKRGKMEREEEEEKLRMGVIWVPIDSLINRAERIWNREKSKKRETLREKIGKRGKGRKWKKSKK